MSETITVLGSGTMGAGIAQAAAAAGYPVRLFDIADAQLQRARASIVSMLEKGVQRGKVTTVQMEETLANIALESNLPAAVKGAELIVEAVPESLDLKRSLFAELDRLASADAILASNTSSLSIDAMAEVTKRPAQVVGMHFFNPVPIMKLLEIVRGAATSDQTIERARGVGERMGKTVILVRNAPGFATSRLGVAIGLEAMRMLEQGVASADDIDTAMTLGYGHPMGPLRLTDLVGLDVRLAIAESLHQRLQSEVFCPPEILRRLVADGKLGKKTGQGFYRWEE